MADTLEKKILLPHMDAEQVSREIGTFIVSSVIHSNATGAVIGLSGGVDSTTTAALAKKAFDAYNAQHNTAYELVGYVLPSNSNQRSDSEDGARVAQRLGIRYEIQLIEPLVQAYATTNNEALESTFHRGNLTSRIRGTVLNTKASTEQKMLLGTGNKDEDFAIGYYTLFGDGAVHISPIARLSKRLVREMAAHLGFTDLAYREPTAGLEVGQTDFKDLGYKYDLVELVSEGLLQGLNAQQLAQHAQVLPLFIAQQKEYAQLFGQVKYAAAIDMISDMQRRNRGAALKAQVLHPPTPTITLEYI